MCGSLEDAPNREKQRVSVGLSLVHNIDADVDVDVDNRNESFSSVDVGVNIKGCRRRRGGFFEV